MTRAVLGLGSNLGDRQAYLDEAVELLGALGATVLAVSDVVQTAPVGGPEQGDFLNLVLVAEADFTPLRWLGVAHECEATARRRRTVRWGPRTLDVDVLAVTDDGREVTSDDPTLTLPHPRALERAFVLVPWAQVAPGDVVAGRTVAEHLAALGDTSADVRTP